MPTVAESRRKPLIMLVGMGNLSSHLLHMLAANPATNRLILAGRGVDTLRRQANLANFTALNLGSFASVEAVHVDLDNCEATAETIAEARPDIIFNGASLQSWRVITALPASVFEKLDQAQLGPWLPMHLTPTYHLMQAVRMSGTSPEVVNAAFPDAVGPTLSKVGLAPTIGIGNIANLVPALTRAFAHLSGDDASKLTVRLVAQHYFSHYLPRFGTAGNGEYHLTVHSDSRNLSEEVRDEDAFALLVGPLKRLGGATGQILTASAAARILTAMATDSGALMHAPAPRGLPGGYPVCVGRHGGTVDLDPTLSLEEAVHINEKCQRADGIERIGDDGTVTFAEPEMAIMSQMLGYDCRSMKVADTAEWATELGRKYQEFAQVHGRG